MTRALRILRAGPAMTIQDMGRVGYLDAGISRGGAADRTALTEGAALLGHASSEPAIEMMGMGGTFDFTENTRIALTGAPMRAQVDGTTLIWNASHDIPAGQQLTIGPAVQGTYGYLHVGGGFAATSARLESQSAHLTAGLGCLLRTGDVLDIAPDQGARSGQFLDPGDRFDGGDIRMVASFQTPLFSPDMLNRFQAKPMIKDARANRMGVKLNTDGGRFQATGGKNILSEAIVPGDIQITGDGTPFVLMCECQTVGGYPRIATVLPCDLPKVAQAPAGARLQFRFVAMEEAVAIEKNAATARAALPRTLRPLIRDPHAMTDLLSYNLISGMIAGEDQNE